MVGPEGLSREELLALLVSFRAAEAAKDARIDALLVQVGELTDTAVALRVRAGNHSLSWLSHLKYISTDWRMRCSYTERLLSLSFPRLRLRKRRMISSRSTCRMSMLSRSSSTSKTFFTPVFSAEAVASRM